MSNDLKFDSDEIYEHFFKEFIFIAGPCTIMTKEHITNIAYKIKKSGAHFLRGGAFKARTSIKNFQGLGARGIKYLLKARREVGIPVISEITSACNLSLYDDIDIIQVGARNMQNFELLKFLGAKNKPILLKRGFANTIDELLKSAEYITNYGNKKVILCERGIRTFENKTRNTLDISSVPIIKKMSEFPVIVDPSHASGRRDLILPLTLASAAVGSFGVMIEVDEEPDNSICDGFQTINVSEFKNIVTKTKKILNILN